MATAPLVTEQPPASTARPARAHLEEPDYTRPLLQVTAAQRESIMLLLSVLYGAERAAACYPEVERLMRVYYAHKTPERIAEDEAFVPAERFTQRDIVLITYGDLISSPDKPPLRALAEFLNRFMRGTINTVHLLPFFPYSSDRGFSVIDYDEVDPRLGTWAEIETLGQNFRLMFDGVFNHASSKSRWFQRFLNGQPGYEQVFIAFTTRDAISADYLRLILRPRTSQLLTCFQTINGPRYVWTTFGPDQVDLNFKNEVVLLRILETLLTYVRRGADIVRLDAVTYIWHELGTSCAHLTETHALVRLFRAVLDVVAPQVALITETNVPHADNVGYFGDGRNEAQLVYNFALPPLVLFSFHAGNCATLARWASGLKPPSPTATFFNFLASHDGIGLLGARDILTPAEIDELVQRTLAHAGLVSYRDNGDGTRSPYELNITWFSALNREGSGEPLALQIQRFVAARAIALALQGVPGIYLPTLFGTKNDTAAVRAGAEPRSINRKAIDERALMAQLADPESLPRQVVVRLRRLLKWRGRHPAFHPNAPQRILQHSDRVFAVLRSTADGQARVLALANVTASPQAVRYDAESLGVRGEVWREISSRRRFPAPDGALSLTLDPYGVLWLSPAWS